MPKYATRTSQFGLVDGTRQPASDLLAIAEPRTPFGPEARKGRLYIAIETTADCAGGCQPCQLVARSVRKAFYSNTSYSVTSSLREAMLAGNKALYEHNFSIPRHQRAYIGLTCAVLKERDLFLAQVAPAQAYVLAGGKLRALPIHPSWRSAHISAAPFIQSSALGASLFVDPELYRCLLQPRDTLLLCSSNLAHLLSAADIEAILRHQEPAETLDHLAGHCSDHGLQSAHAIAVQLVTQARQGAHSRATPGPSLGAQGRKLWHALGGRFARRDAQPAEPADPPAASPRHPLTSYTEADANALRTPPPEQPIMLTSFPPRPQPIDMGESLEARHEQANAERLARLPPSAFLGEGNDERMLPNPQEPIDLSDMALLTQARPYRARYQHRPLADMRWPEQLLMPVRWLGAELANQFSRRPAIRSSPSLASRSASGRRADVLPQRQPFPWMKLLTLLVLLAVLIIYGLNMSQRSADDRALAYLEEAEARMEAVAAAPDISSAAERLQDAEQALEALQTTTLITSTNPAFWLRYQDIQRDYEQALGGVYRLNFLDEPTVLAEHPLPGGRFDSVVIPAATTTVTQNYALEALQYIYALDGTSEEPQLFRIPRAGGAPEPYLSPGEVVGATIVGPLRGQLWRFDSVIAIDEGIDGFGYYFRNNEGWNYTRMGGSEAWTSRRRIDLETFAGNLYVWGAWPNEILKFSPGRYANAPEFWIDPEGLEGQDLGTSVDMAIDGRIYLLQPNGTILVLELGRFERAIVPENMTPPINAVTRLIVTEDQAGQGWVFLLDTLGERIIQLDKESGQLIQQVKMRRDSPIQFNLLTAFAVDTSTIKPIVYVVNGGQIIRVALPAPPAPFSPPGSDADEGGG